MGLFKCSGCEASGKEIDHLLAEITELHKHLDRAYARLTELQAPQPGAERRAVPLPTRPLKPADVVEARQRREAAAESAALNFPGYERPEPPRYEELG